MKIEKQQVSTFIYITCKKAKNTNSNKQKTDMRRKKQDEPSCCCCCLIVIFLLIASSFWVIPTILQIQEFLNTQPNEFLGYSESTSPNSTEAQVDSFIESVKLASIFYREDTKTRLEFISDRMNSIPIGPYLYGFSVIQLDDNQNSQSVFYYNLFYGSVTAGVDQIFPQHGYMFICQRSRSNQRVYFSKIEQKGIGITPELEKIIRNTILSVQTTKACICMGLTKKISSFLGKYNGEKWSVFCSNTTLNNEFNVYAQNDAYIYTRPRKCNYAIYQT